ncbi:hypothetical protein C8J56DRAFT_742654, partial [Mycena floridula]
MPSINDSKCVLITGATSGIGRSLAQSIHALPTKPTVIGTGRRADRLDELKGLNIDTFHLELDSDRATLKKFVDDILQAYPELDTIILNAGIQRMMNLKYGINLDDVDREIRVNYLSVVALIGLFLPHLLKLSTSRPCFIITVTSGLGLRPAPQVANYSASKAALHSFTTCLQVELDDTNVYTFEIIPPLVESELHDADGTTGKLSKFWMPLIEFTEVAMEGLMKGNRHIAAG